MSRLLELTTKSAFYALAGTAAITLIGAVDPTETNDKKKNALAMETSVNVIASVVYLELSAKLLSGDYASASDLRYVDWFITTPLLLGSFVFYCTYADETERPDGKQRRFNGALFAVLIALNLGMLLSGFLARSPQAAAFDAVHGSLPLYVAGMACFAGLAAVIVAQYWWVWMVYVFLSVWLLYGLAFLLPVLLRESAYNVLDVVSKALFGVFLYFGMK
jgi:bacteriorhodopsin